MDQALHAARRAYEADPADPRRKRAFVRALRAANRPFAAWIAARERRPALRDFEHRAPILASIEEDFAADEAGAFGLYLYPWILQSGGPVAWSDRPEDVCFILDLGEPRLGFERYYTVHEAATSSAELRAIEEQLYGHLTFASPPFDEPEPLTS